MSLPKIYETVPINFHLLLSHTVPICVGGLRLSEVLYLLEILWNDIYLDGYFFMNSAFESEPLLSLGSGWRGFLLLRYWYIRLNVTYLGGSISIFSMIASSSSILLSLIDFIDL